METLSKACFSPGSIGLLFPLKDFLEDELVSEILINKPEEVFIERQGELLPFAAPILTPQYLRRLFILIANENKQSLSQDSPILSGNLQDGSRVQLVIPPVAQFETLSIRKFTIKELGFDEYASQCFFAATKTSSLNFSNSHGLIAGSIGFNPSNPKDSNLQTLYEEKNWQEFITQAIYQKKNIIISGGTSSGKTTFLNSCLAKIPLHERLITLEDTYEIQAPHKNIVRLKALKTTGERVALTSMQDLVQASLRLRPDRLIMGEIRGQEIFDFVSACSTGHSGSLATLHANNPQIAFMRMAQLYKLNQVAGMSEADIYKVLNEVIDIILQLEKRDGRRQLVEVYYKDALKNFPSPSGEGARRVDEGN